MKSQKTPRRVLLPDAMAVAVGVIVSLPSWFLLTSLGAGLILGAYLLYQNGQ